MNIIIAVAHACTYAHVRVRTVVEANRCPGHDEIKSSIKEEEKEDTMMAMVVMMVVVVVVEKRGEGKEGRKVVPRARWQPSASRVQGRTSPLRVRFPSSVMDDDDDDDGSLGIQNRLPL